MSVASNGSSRADIESSSHDIRASPTNAVLGAVVVTYYPDRGILERLEKIVEQSDLTVVVDNASPDTFARVLQAFVAERHGVEVIGSPVNIGLAAALNRGVEAAIDGGCSHVCTFDQDSDVSPHYRQRMLASLATMPPGRSLLGCNFHDRHRGRARHRIPSDEHGRPLPRKTVIGSGMMFDKELHERIGGFDESYFIDSVDHEFCLRVRSVGGVVALHAQPLIEHTIGDAPFGAFARCGVRLAYSHPPSRRYTMARNTLYTIRRHGAREIVWSLNQVARLVCEGLSIALFESESRAKARAFAKGLRDGMISRRSVSNRSGPRHPT